MSLANYIQWYNENEGRSYPLREEATRRTITGLYLPNNLIVDANVMIPPGYANPYVSSLRITPSTISVSISCSSGGLLVGTYPLASFNPYVAYPLEPAVDDVSGWIVFGSYNAIGVEDYRFTNATQSGLETRVVHTVQQLPVFSLIKLGGNPLHYLRGVIKLRAGNGVRIEFDPSLPSKITVRLTPEAAQATLGPCCESASKTTCGVPPLRSINGVCADINGRITLRFE